MFDLLQLRPHLCLLQPMRGCRFIQLRVSSACFCHLAATINRLHDASKVIGIGSTLSSTRCSRRGSACIIPKGALPVLPPGGFGWRSLGPLTPPRMIRFENRQSACPTRAAFLASAAASRGRPTFPTAHLDFCISEKQADTVGAQTV